MTMPVLVPLSFPITIRVHGVYTRGLCMWGGGSGVPCRLRGAYHSLRAEAGLEAFGAGALGYAHDGV